jgi:enoyl-CoA hydratase
VESEIARGEDASATEGAGAGDGDIGVGADGCAGLVRLNRPRALNALTTAMRARIAEGFSRWGRDPQIYAAIICSTTDRAFCAGGDIKESIERGRAQPAEARRSLAEEYALNWQLDCFSKPTVSLIDGVVIGSGVGISLYGTHRVAGERYRFAMPEVGIGLFPDDGVSFPFAAMPDEIGMYLALTGRAIGRADAYALGLVTHCIPVAQFGAIHAAIRVADPVDPVLDDRHQDPGPGDLEAVRPLIARCFSADTVEGIVARLRAERGDGAAWAEGVLSELARHSPTSLKITHRHVRSLRHADLRTALIQDYRLACRCLEAHDFYEGVRALLIDRDRNPKWQPARLEDVTEAMVDRYFSPMGADDLSLASRAEMQAVRK